jgi:uncharacterized membrane protein
MQLDSSESFGKNISDNNPNIGRTLSIIKNSPFLLFGMVCAGGLMVLIASTQPRGQADGIATVVGLVVGIAAFFISRRAGQDWYWALTHGVTIVSSTWVTPRQQEHTEVDEQGRPSPLAPKDTLSPELNKYFFSEANSPRDITSGAVRANRSAATVDSRLPTPGSAPQSNNTNRDNRGLVGILAVCAVVIGVLGYSYFVSVEHQRRADAIARQEREERRQAASERAQEVAREKRERAARELKEVADRSLASLEKQNREMEELAQRMRADAAARERERERQEEARQREITAAAQRRQVEVCNTSNCELFVGTVQYVADKSQWLTRGWFSVPANSCEQVGDYPVEVTSYIYAQQNQAYCRDRLNWIGPHQFCLPYVGLYRMTGDLPRSCTAQGDEHMGFSEMYISAGVGGALQMTFRGN